jgi:TetR/AcrR family transcriptional repressor of nem operon
MSILSRGAEQEHGSLDKSRDHEVFMTKRAKAAGDLESESGSDLSYIRFMEDTLAKDPPTRKSDRTRARLRIACARALEEHGYHSMRVVDITQKAGVAEGLFYAYFKDKLEITLQVLTIMLEDVFSKQSLAFEPAPRHSGLHLYDAIFRANLKWILTCRANAGLMRCVLQVGDQQPEFSKLFQQINSAWYERVATAIVRQRPGRKPAMMFTILLGSMMDEIVRRLIVYPDPAVYKVLEELKGDDELIAHASTLVWLRMMYPDAPLPTELPKGAQLLANWSMPTKS